MEKEICEIVVRVSAKLEDAPNASPAVVDADLGETKRTWKIKDELWEDFTALVAISGLTQAEYVNKLIADAISENRARIVKFKEITKK